MSCGHGGSKISGGFVVGLGLLTAPMHEEAGGETGESSVDVNGIY
jgi:hypothetical protein